MALRIKIKERLNKLEWNNLSKSSALHLHIDKFSKEFKIKKIKQIKELEKYVVKYLFFRLDLPL